MDNIGIKCSNFGKRTDLYVKNANHKEMIYHSKQDIIDELFCQYIKPLLKYIDNLALIQE